MEKNFILISERRTNMKKIIAFLLTAIMLAMTLASCGTVEVPTETQAPSETEKPTSAPSEKPTLPPKEPVSGSEDAPGENMGEPVYDGFDPVIRFAVTSDTHITTPDGRQAQRTAKMIRQMNGLGARGDNGYVGMDALLIAGDLTDGGTWDHYLTAFDVLVDNVDANTDLVLAMGNHDWLDYEGNSKKKFESVFGYNCSIKDTVIGGYHFITVYANEMEFNFYGWEYSQAVKNQAEELIKAAIADTGEDKPVFIVQHIGNRGTAGGTATSGSSSVLNDMYEKYDNLVVFSGHSHFPINDECSVYQKDYTSLNTGTINYASVGAKAGNNDIPFANPHEYAQCYVVELDANHRMRVRCWDVLQAKFVGDAWIIESWSKDKFVYTPDRFEADDIFFAEDAEITLFQAFETGAVINVPSLPKESLSGRVIEAKVFTQSGTLVNTVYIGTQYYNERQDSVTRVGLSGLEKNTSYKVEVRALNSLYDIDVTGAGTLATEPLEFSFKTANGINDGKADIFDLSVDAAANTVSNSLSNKYELDPNTNITTQHDNTVNKDVIVFDGTTDKAVKLGDYTFIENELTDSMSVEIYFKVTAFPGGNKQDVILGAMETGGFGIGVKPGGAATFSMYDGSKYQSIPFTVALNTYYHVVAVYDGENFTLYVNGERIDSKPMSKLVFTKTAAAKCIYLGADTHWNGEALTPSKCAVADFKLYSYALSEAQVAATYNAK